MIGLLGSTKPPRKVPITDPGYRGTGLFVGLVFAIVITFFVTLGRLLTRAYRKGQKFGADDWVIIPGAVGSSPSPVDLQGDEPLILIVELSKAAGASNYRTRKLIVGDSCNSSSHWPTLATFSLVFPTHVLESISTIAPIKNWVSSSR